jgi:hypothetical protein
VVSVEVAEFAASVSALVAANPTPDRWRPGSLEGDEVPRLHELLAGVGWHEVASHEDSVAFVGPAAVALGRGLVAVCEIDVLLGGSPVVGGLVRYAAPGATALVRDRSGLRPVRLLESDPVAYGDSWAVRSVTTTEELPSLEPILAARRERAFIAASVGYLAGLASEAVSIAVDHARQREAFGKTLAQLDTVQQRLADAATEADGLLLLAEGTAGVEALAYAGPAACAVLAHCHQVLGALGYTLEFPLQRYSRRARAVQLWADGWIDAIASGAR